ncbi:MAG: Gfo/Idh/MocA family oxidoreductase [Candidatus Omnitrophica bacterium]|nr:Gfo/Idh/MocA family oxidoreductase [Candidatus Omnitrophota bacterium]
MKEHQSNRRDFVKQTATLTALAASSKWASGAFAGSDETLKVGLIGCGGRGSGAVVQALTADKNTKLIAMADVFKDRIESSLDGIKGSDVADRVDVPEDRQFVGFDAYKPVTDLCDVVVLTSTPHFRPEHLTYAVEKGKHVFAEKPVATDPAGIQTVRKAVDLAKEKNVCLVSGLCWRYFIPRVETMKRVADGQIGDIVAIETTYNSGGVWPPRKRRSEVDSDMAYQLRNWYYYTWLSGDHIVEQAVHAIDTMAWAMGDEPPTLVWGSGGRQVRTQEMYGNIWDHFGLVYEYPNGVRGYHQCRHWKGTDSRVQDYVLGSNGICDVFGKSISGPNAWAYEGEEKNMYQNEHDHLFAAIRRGEAVNDGEYMWKSTLLGIMGRMAAYSGETITWEQAVNSELKLGPDKYEWGDAPEVVIAMPGKTKYT